MSVTRWYRAVLLLVLSAIAPIVVVVASAHAYDASAPARVDARESALAQPGQHLLGGSRGRSASPSVDARGSSASSEPTSVATEAAGGSLDSSVVYRYVSEGEANAAAKVGRVPNTDLLGQPRSVFYSPDYIDSVAEAEQSLQIGAMNPGGATASPGFRITASPQGAQWTYGGNVAGGSGIEMLTDQALKVLRIDRLPR